VLLPANSQSSVRSQPSDEPTTFGFVHGQTAACAVPKIDERIRSSSRHTPSSISEVVAACSATNGSGDANDISNNG